MSILKAMCIAFAMYSKIPVPQFDWKEKDMKYTLLFFPWVGIIIGLVFYGWSVLCIKAGIGSLMFSMIGTAIPLILTGGFHVDGYMDTMDAFHSYQPRERKLAILKDSHIGAFSVIMLILYYLIYVGALSEICSLKYLSIVSFGFFISRCLSGISVVTFQGAKKDGLLYTFASSAHKNVVRSMLLVELAVGIVLMVLIAWIPALICLGLGLLTFLYYRVKSMRELGGITGDTAGYFLTLLEASFVVGGAVCQILGL